MGALTVASLTFHLHPRARAGGGGSTSVGKELLPGMPSPAAQECQGGASVAQAMLGRGRPGTGLGARDREFLMSFKPLTLASHEH